GPSWPITTPIRPVTVSTTCAPTAGLTAPPPRAAARCGRGSAPGRRGDRAPPAQDSPGPAPVTATQFRPSRTPPAILSPLPPLLRRSPSRTCLHRAPLSFRLSLFSPQGWGVLPTLGRVSGATSGGPHKGVDRWPTVHGRPCGGSAARTEQEAGGGGGRAGGAGSGVIAPRASTRELERAVRKRQGDVEQRIESAPQTDGIFERVRRTLMRPAVCGLLHPCRFPLFSGARVRSRRQSNRCCAHGGDNAGGRPTPDQDAAA